MATKFQIKRTSIGGRTPNTADPANTSYIAAGELALNLTDKKLFSSNGTSHFEIGAFKVELTNSTSNVSTFTEISTLQFDQDSGFDVTNPAAGTAKIAINSTFKFWQVDGTQKLTASGLDTVNFVSGNNITISANGSDVPQSITFATSLTPTFTSATFGNSTVNTTVNSTAISVKSLVANGGIGTAGDVLFSNGSGSYWAPSGALGTNVNATFAWTNTHSFSNTITFNGIINANGASGSNGQVLTANSTGGVYWANSTGGGGVSIASYVYPITSNTTLIQGSDTNSKVLTYTIGREDVYLNGIKLLLANDYVQTNTTAITLTSNAVSGDVIEVVVISGSQQPNEFKYTITSNTTTVTGADDNAAILYYTPGQELVYINGVKVITNDDYTTPNTSHVVFTANVTSNDTVEIVAFPNTTEDLLDGLAYGSSNTDILVIDTFGAGSYRTAKYLVQANTVDSFHSSEALVIHDGTTAFVSEYGMVYSNGSLFSLSADISSGVVRLKTTPTRSGTVFKTKRITLGV